MKRILIFSFITFFLYAGMRAQSVGIDEVLHRIEANNKELQANAQLITSHKKQRSYARMKKIRLSTVSQVYEAYLP